MARTQADAFYQFHEEAITPLKNRITDLEKDGLAIEVGDNQPAGDRIWLDTSAYASLQGETPNFLVGNGGTLKVVASDTQPTNYDLWLDTSNNGGLKNE